MLVYTVYMPRRFLNIKGSKGKIIDWLFKNTLLSLPLSESKASHISFKKTIRPCLLQTQIQLRSLSK